VHDLNPGVTQNGVFWTTVVSADAVHVDSGAGTPSLEVHDLPQKDYVDFENAILGNGPKPRMGMVSLRVECFRLSRRSDHRLLDHIELV